MKKNVILVDFKVNENWNFINGIKESTNLDWEVVEKVSNYSQKNKLLNFKRYLAYFMFSLKNFFSICRSLQDALLIIYKLYHRPFVITN